MKDKIVFTPKLLTSSEQDITDSKVVSNSDLLCREMDIRIGRGHGRRGRPVGNAELREEVRTLRARLEALETSIHQEHTRDTSE